MELITRDEMVRRMRQSNRIQSVTWKRRVDKVVKRCVNCEAETASHNGDRFCNACNAFVETHDVTEASAGDRLTMQFIPRIPPNGTKNFTPAGGFLFNAPSLEVAEAMKRKHGLEQVLKMGEQVGIEIEAGEIRRRIQSGDMKALPRVIPVDDIELWVNGGVEYVLVD